MLRSASSAASEVARAAGNTVLAGELDEALEGIGANATEPEAKLLSRTPAT